MKPTLGRIVIFHDRVRGREFPAIVNVVMDASLGLYVFDPAAPRQEAFVPHRGDASVSGNFWDWPPRVTP